MIQFIYILLLFDHIILLIKNKKCHQPDIKNKTHFIHFIIIYCRYKLIILLWIMANGHKYIIYVININQYPQNDENDVVLHKHKNT